MDTNIIKQVKDVESEADRVIQEGKLKAAQVEGAVAREADALRKEREATVEQEATLFKAKVERETADELASLDAMASKASARLDAVDKTSVSKAVDMILQRLSQG